MSIEGINASIFIILIVLCSMSIFCSQVFKKRFEEIIPITIMGIIFILYLFGIFDILKIGVYIVVLIALFLYIYAFLNAYIKKSFFELFKNTFTPCFFIFTIFFIALVQIHRGRLLTSWDEFSHWGDSVKAMYSINDFITNPDSGCYFKSYPPAMALFQYFWQVIAGSFNEWLLFIGYQIFGLSLFLPFLKKIRWNHFLKILLITVVIIYTPVIFFFDYYTVIYIDPILGLVFGFGLATVFVKKEYDLLTAITLFFTLFTLILLKDVGLFLASIIFFIIVIDIIFFKKLLFKIFNENNLKYNLKKISIIPFLLVAILFAKYSWSYMVKINNIVPPFSQPIFASELIKILSGNDNTYKSQVVSKFIDGIQTTPMTLVFQPLSFYAAFGIFILVFFYFYKIDENKKRAKFFIITVLIGDIIFLYGLLVLYLFTYSPNEALALASFGRYMNIYFQGLFMFTSLTILSNISNFKNIRLDLIFLLSFLFINGSTNTITKLLYKSTDSSIQFRKPFNDTANIFTSVVGKEKHNVYLIAQNDLQGGFAYWILRFTLRPNTLPGNFSWSIGTSYGKHDQWTRLINADQWIDELVTGFDYVLIYGCDDKFIKEFGKVFKNPDNVLKDFNNRKIVYKVNKKDRCLEIINK